MKKIITRRKSSRRPQEVVSMPDSPCMSSLASYFLLKEQYCQNDPNRKFIDPLGP